MLIFWCESLVRSIEGILVNCLAKLLLLLLLLLYPVLIGFLQTVHYVMPLYYFQYYQKELFAIGRQMFRLSNMMTAANTSFFFAEVD
jgi:hypothetical protein